MTVENAKGTALEWLGADRGTPWRYVVAAAWMFAISGCATSVSVEKVQSGDATKSCEELASSIHDADKFRREAESKKGVTGTNAAAVLFFWPGLLVTYSDANAAIKAADQRKEYLVDLRAKKGCAPSS